MKKNTPLEFYATQLPGIDCSELQFFVKDDDQQIGRKFL